MAFFTSLRSDTLKAVWQKLRTKRTSLNWIQKSYRLAGLALSKVRTVGTVRHRNIASYTRSH